MLEIEKEFVAEMSEKRPSIAINAAGKIFGCNRRRKGSQVEEDFEAASFCFFLRPKRKTND